MSEPKTTVTEQKLFLDSLDSALKDIVAIHGNGVELIGLPVEEWAGPGYAVGALFDPYVVGSLPACQQEPEISASRETSSRGCKLSRVYLEYPASAPEKGAVILETRKSQKEKITFRTHAGRSPVMYLPTLWGGVGYHRLQVSNDWHVLAQISEQPALAVRDGTAVFAFNPLRVLHRHLLMAEPATTRDLTDLMVLAVLGASGITTDLDDNELRRDFHALGVNVLLVAQLYRVAGRVWDSTEITKPLRRAAEQYRQGDFGGAKDGLAALFKLMETRRRAIVETPIYIMVMPHGGILFENEGYAEYDWPEAAAKALNLFLDWGEQFGFKFAPDIGAGTLEEFVKLHPATIQRFRDAWGKGQIEFVNGSFSQPYTQLWPLWDQDKQFEVGLKTFDTLFGRHPKVYAAQEISLHPSLPDLLKKHGYNYAIHRSQNLGVAPIDTAALIEWTAPTTCRAAACGAPTGSKIRTLPAHPLRSERRGGETWRHFPVMLTSEKNQGLPFIALTSLMDQTFIDIYNEEILRANQYAPVWGEFVTPSEFFEKTKAIAAEERCYSLDQYHYELDLSGNSIHGHQTGGYSSEHAFMFKESARLQELEKVGVVPEKELKKLLNQEAHDCYIIPYFTQGYFMEGGLTDYLGPRYRCSNDKPRGIDRCIRDAAGYPKAFSDAALASPEPCSIGGATICSQGKVVEIDSGNGSIRRLGGRDVALGALKYNGAPLKVREVKSAGDKLCVAGMLPGFGEVTVEYFISGGWLYGEITAASMDQRWDDTRIGWGDCVYLEHARPSQPQVVRTVSGVTQPTALERFHSLDSLELKGAGQSFHLRHGGNIFFQQTPVAVQNRLWCYDEFCNRFYWAIFLKDNI